MAQEIKAAVSVDPFVGGGEMGALMRSLDWSQTPVGPVASWPQSLRTALSILLSSHHPVLIWWGPKLIQFYNDAYRSLLGKSKHPQALGQRGEDCWSEVWPVIGPMVERVKNGESIWTEDTLLFLDRNGYLEECYFSDAYSPLRDDDGQINGVLCLCREETARVLRDRRLRMLHELTAHSAKANAIEETCQIAGDILATNPHDIPFALLYRLTAAGQAQLVSAVGIDPGTEISPKQIDLQDSSQAVDCWPLQQVRQTKRPEIVRNLADKLGDLAPEAGLETPTAAAVMPLAQSGQPQLAGFLILGISPSRLFDDDYRDFFDRVAAQVETAIAHASAHEAAERKVNVVLESISDAFVAFDRQWRYTYVNKKATELLHRSRADLIGNHVWENVFPERVGVPVYQELQRVLNEKVPAVFEIFDPVLEKWVEAHAYPSTEGVSVYFHDISDRKTNEFKRQQAEAELREAHVQLESALRAGAVYTWRWNIPQNRVTVDAAFAHLFGVDAASAKREGLPLEDFSSAIHQADRDRVLAAIQRTLETGELYAAEYRIVTASREERWVRARGQVEYDAAGNPVSFPGAVIDITERKHAEAERSRLLAQAKAAQEAAEAANRVKDEFLAVVSHELRSPLNPILGWSQILRKRQLSAEKTAYALETIERNAKMQAQLINDLLDVSRILRGKLSLAATLVDLAAVVDMAMETVRLAADAKSIQIETHFDPAVGPVSGDSGRLQQIVWNLLSNAVKFTPAGGKVSIRLAQLGHSAQITVSDTGKGIEPDFLPHVFERFHQADAATTRRFGGLGLGLAIVRSLVELHGGTIEAESAGEDYGATFTVSLPVIPCPAAVEPATPLMQSADLSGVRVLVVDDDENARELMRCLLEIQGAVATITASAGEAIAALTQDPPDIILSDIGMPDVDGYMLMRQVRALPSEQGGEIPAIALTAYASEIDHRQSAAAGFQQHIAKPIEAEELIRAIARLVNP